jgi:hypothetical protein
MINSRVDFHGLNVVYALYESPIQAILLVESNVVNPRYEKWKKIGITFPSNLNNPYTKLLLLV